MKKILIIISIVLFVLLSIPLTVYLVQQRQELRMRAVPATDLSLIPATATHPAGEPFTVQVQINTGVNIAAVADIILTYDPQILEATSVSAGGFFPDPTIVQNVIDQSIGKIIFSLITLTPQQGTGTLVNVIFNGIGAGSSLVNFAGGTVVGEVNEGNILDNTNPGHYTITTSAQATPTPTAGIQTTPTPTTGTGTTPTPTSQAATPTPTPTPTTGTGTTPSPTSTPTRTPTPTSQAATPTPTPTPTAGSIPETGTTLPTFLFILSGGALLAFGLLRLLLY